MRGAVVAYLVAAMSYLASGSTMPDFQATVINATTLPPATTYLFVVGLKFVPLFVLVLAYWVVLGFYGDAGFSAKLHLSGCCIGR
jgi:hypothetical protein